MVLVAERVHRVPEAIMLEGHQFTLLRESDQRLGLEAGGIPLDQIDTCRGKDEETPIDEAAIAARLCRKAGDAGPPALESTVASRRPYCRDGGVATMSAMKCDFRADIDIGEAISIGETESLFPLQVIAHP